MTGTTQPVVMQVYPMLHAAGEQLLREHVRLITASAPSEECIRHEGSGAVAIIARRPIRIGGDVMDALPSLSVLSATGSGADCFDVAAATARGIPVLHNPGVAPGPVAEYVIAAIPMLLKRIVPADQFLRAGGDWEPKDRFRGDEAAGRTLGLVGFGHIARDVARRAQAGLDMEVVAYSRTTPDAEYEELGVEPCRTLDELLARADVVSINVPYSADTKGMFDAAVIAKMRPGAILVNTARGGIVDDVALAAAIRAGRIGGAAVDVFEPGLPGPNHPLFGLTNLTKAMAVSLDDAAAQTGIVGAQGNRSRADDLDDRCGAALHRRRALLRRGRKLSLQAGARSTEPTDTTTDSKGIPDDDDRGKCDEDHCGRSVDGSRRL